MASSLNPVADGLRDIVEALRAIDASFALVGGLAVSARGEPRTTPDVDIAVASDDDHATDRILHVLAARQYTVRGVLHARGRIAAARLLHANNPDALIDLLFASSGIETEVIAAAELVTIGGDLVVPIATRAHLIALKVLVRDDHGRPQDYDDLQSLLAEASVIEKQQARRALRLISARGYARGRDLDRGLDDAIAIPPRKYG